MALEALAAGLVVKVRDQTSRGIATIGQAFQGLKRKGADLRGAMSALTPVFASLAVGGTVLAGGIAYAGKKAIDFEKQLSAVRAVSNANSEQFGALSAEIKRLGATTVFSATQAAQGAENLARAGFGAEETIDALSGTLAAAAADGIDLATSARLIANNVKAFGLDAKDANRVADVLAATSARTNTNMVELGEGLKYVAPIARGLGVSIEDTSAALGVLANAGLQGSVGGTALKNALLKMAKPSAEGAKLMKKYGFGIVTAADGSVNLAKTIGNLSTAMGKIPSKLDKVAFAQEVFGIRGEAAVDNLVAAMEKSGGALDEQFAKITGNVDGAAKKMADIRIDNVAGAFTLLGSALEGLAIELFTDRLGTMKDSIMFVANAVGVIVETLQQAKDGFIVESEAMEEFRAKFGPLTDTLIAFGMGMSKGLGMIQKGIKIVTDFGKKLAGIFGAGSDIAEGLGTFAVIATPIIAVLGLIAGAAALVAAPFIAFGGAIVAALKVAGIALIGIVGGLALFGGVVNKNRREGESFGDALMRTFGALKDFAMDFAGGVKEGYEMYLLPAFTSLKEAGAALVDAFGPIFDEIGAAFGGASGDGASMGETIVAAIGAIAEVLAWLVKNVLSPVIKFFASNFVGPMISGLSDIVGGFIDLVTGADTVGNSLLRIFKGIGKTILTTLLLPLRSALDLVIKAAQAVGLGDNAIISGASKALEALQFKEGTVLGQGRVGPKVVTGFGKKTEKGGGLVAPKVASVKAAKTPQVNIENKPADQKIDVNNKMCVDGREMAAATGRVEIENLERLGGVQTPFFNRAIRSVGNTTAPSGR